MKKIMFCGGGSAGHVIPNLAVCEQLKGSFELCYIGTNAIEKQICAENGIEFYQFDGAKFVRGKILCNLTLPLKLIKSVADCKRILGEVRPDLLFCKGGYVSVPPALAATKLGITVLTHESDLSPGLANKLIAKRCRRVLTSFPATASRIKNGVYTGSPMRNNLFGRDKFTAKEQLGLDMRPTVLVFGGGGGSAVINENLRKCVGELCKTYNVLHVCGKGNLVNSNIYGYKQLEFTEDMGLIYACADYAVARCGSNSAHELIALKIPTLFIPLENKRSRGDQLANAQYFAKRGLCRVLREKELNQTALIRSVRELVNDERLKAALAVYDCKRGNRAIIDEIISALN